MSECSMLNVQWGVVMGRQPLECGVRPCEALAQQGRPRRFGSWTTCPPMRDAIPSAQFELRPRPPGIEDTVAWQAKAATAPPRG